MACALGIGIVGNCRWGLVRLEEVVEDTALIASGVGVNVLVFGLCCRAGSLIVWVVQVSGIVMSVPETINLGSTVIHTLKAVDAARILRFKVVHRCVAGCAGNLGGRAIDSYSPPLGILRRGH